MLTADLGGQTAMVTGASSGIGEHFARVLAQAGAHVILAARRVERLEAVADQIRQQGGSAMTVPLDVGSPESVEAAMREAPGVDILVNNAGLSSDKGILETTEDDWRRTFDVNLDGVWRMSKAAIQAAVDNGRPASIINIASITGLRPQTGISAYASSKAAVVHLTKSLALDCARFNIRVNAIAPGYFRTDINDEFLEMPFADKMIKRIPQRRIGQLDELDGALLLLASSASRYMTGTVIPVDGGHLCSTL